MKFFKVLANAGYLDISTNALSAIDRKPASEDEARAPFSELKADNNLQNFVNAFSYLKTRKDFNSRTAV